MENETNCTNCRYYLAHYIKRNTKYYNIHTINGNNKNRHKKRLPELCELWEDIAIKKEERKKSIKETLESMSERLNVIAMILKDDTE